MQTCLNNYIVRIYRLDRKDHRQLVGLVEEVGGKEKRPFTNLHELWEILSHPERTSAGAGRKRVR